MLLLLLLLAVWLVVLCALRVHSKSISTYFICKCSATTWVVHLSIHRFSVVAFAVVVYFSLTKSLTRRRAYSPFSLIYTAFINISFSIPLYVYFIYLFIFFHHCQFLYGFCTLFFTSIVPIFHSYFSSWRLSTLFSYLFTGSSRKIEFETLSDCDAVILCSLFTYCLLFIQFFAFGCCLCCFFVLFFLHYLFRQLFCAQNICGKTEYPEGTEQQMRTRIKSSVTCSSWFKIFCMLNDNYFAIKKYWIIKKFMSTCWWQIWSNLFFLFWLFRFILSFVNSFSKRFQKLQLKCVHCTFRIN